MYEIHQNGEAPRATRNGSGENFSAADPRDSFDLGYASSPEASNDINTASKPEIMTSKAGLIGTSANLINSIVGAGIIGLPYAFRQSGWIAGLFLLCLVGYLTDRSLRLIINLATFHPKLRDYHVTTFEKLASFPFGGLGKAMVLLSMFIMGYGAMVAYFLIVKDTVPTMLGFEHDAGVEREIILVITSALVMLPLSMQRDMANLSFTSAISVTADLILVFFVFWFAPVSESIQAEGGLGQVLRQDAIRPTLFIGLGVLSTAMACQHSAFIVSGSLESLTKARWALVTGSSIGIATILCAALGSAGYFGFLDETQGNVLNNFDAESPAANGARGLLAITMLFTYPMEAFVVRHVISCIFFAGDLEADQDLPPLLCGTDNGCCNLRYRLTFVIYIATLIPALIFDDLGPVLSITGSLGGSFVAYVLPGLVFFGVNGEHFTNHCHKLLHESASSGKASVKSSGDTDGNIELPVAGGATQPDGAVDTTTGNLVLPVEGQQIEMVVFKKSKPLWWFLLGYPVWYAIASTGRRGIQEKLAKLAREGTTFSPNDSQVESGNQPSRSLADPTQCDYFTAMLFIVFGVVAAVAGFSTNIYVIMKGIDVAT